MGLGKTVEILALILANPHPNPPELDPPVTARKPSPPVPEGGVPSKATLVVCAVSLVGQWISEAKGKLSAPCNMYKYHGQGRSTDPFFLAGQDIVRSIPRHSFSLVRLRFDSHVGFFDMQNL